MCLCSVAKHMSTTIELRVYNMQRLFIFIIFKIEISCRNNSNEIWDHLILFVCLFVWNSSSHSRIFHRFVDVTITGKGLKKFDLCSVHMNIEQ